MTGARNDQYDVLKGAPDWSPSDHTDRVGVFFLNWQSPMLRQSGAAPGGQAALDMEPMMLFGDGARVHPSTPV